MIGVETTSHIDSKSRATLVPAAAGKRLASLAVHAALITGAVVLMLPLAWMLSTSLKEPAEVFVYPPTWIPSPIRWSTYLEVFTRVPFGRYALNTALITGLDIVGKLLSCSLVAFAFARLRWPGRDVLFLVMLATLMLPPQVTLIPQ